MHIAQPEPRIDEHQRAVELDQQTVAGQLTPAHDRFGAAIHQLAAQWTG
jgi:hypothetical protein